MLLSYTPQPGEGTKTQTEQNKLQNRIHYDKIIEKSGVE